MNKGVNKKNLDKLIKFIKNDVHHTKQDSKHNKGNLRQPQANK